jgi:hypothetical protein
MWVGDVPAECELCGEPILGLRSNRFGRADDDDVVNFTPLTPMATKYHWPWNLYLGGPSISALRLLSRTLESPT